MNTTTQPNPTDPGFWEWHRTNNPPVWPKPE
jgi:hypothetical protein